MTRKHNPVAKDLRTGKYRPRVVAPKKGKRKPYRRKPRTPRG